MRRRSISLLGFTLLGLGLVVATACSDDNNSSECSGDDCGGAAATGGSKATGGATATGGSKAIGGSKATGGTTNQGGAGTTGGSTGVGGTTTVGGTSATTGGSKATGGSSAATGGKSSTGGTTATGGSSAATGGKSSTGGTTATGGSSAATGGTSAATGGTSAATGGTSAATGGTSAATGGTSAATGGSSASGGTTSEGGSSATGGTTASGGTSAISLGATNLALSAAWCGDGLSPAATPCTTFPRIFATSVQNVSSNTPAALVDGSQSTFLVTATLPTAALQQIVGFEFATAVTISGVVIKGRLNGLKAYNPKAYTVETSDNGTDWNLPASGTGTAWTVQATMTEANTWPIIATSRAASGTIPAITANTAPVISYFQTPVTAKWIRLVITDTYYGDGGYTYASPITNSNCQIAELEVR